MKNSLFANLLRAHIRSGLRGQTRHANLVAKHLRKEPIHFGDRPPVFMDLSAPDAAAFWLSKDWSASPWEANEQAIMRQFVKQGDIVYDIGAHVGLHTMLLSTLVGPSGKVFAFEPNPHVFDLLSTTIKSASNIVLLPFALSDSEREANLYVPKDGDSTGSLREWQNHDSVDVFACHTKRLENLELPNPSFIKIDIEGGEAQALAGAGKIIDSEHAPVILFEHNPQASKVFGDSPIEFLQSLQRPRYTIYSIDVSGRLTLEAMDRPYWNMLALPLCRTAPETKLNTNARA